MRLSLCISISETNHALLTKKAEQAGAGTSPEMIARDLVDNYCATIRMQRRLRVPEEHYTARDGSDFEEGV